jgi:hypothetical protein
MNRETQENCESHDHFIKTDFFVFFLNFVFFVVKKIRVHSWQKNNKGVTYNAVSGLQTPAFAAERGFPPHDTRNRAFRR